MKRIQMGGLIVVAVVIGGMGERLLGTHRAIFAPTPFATLKITRTVPTPAASFDSVPLPSACSLEPEVETDIYRQLPSTVRQGIFKDLDKPVNCEFARDVLDLIADPDRTSPGHTCNLSKRQRAALDSLAATAEIPLTAHPCFLQELILSKLAAAPADQRMIVWLQLQTYHPDTYGSEYLPPAFKMASAEIQQLHNTLKEAARP